MNDPTLCECYCHIGKANHPLRCCSVCDICSGRVRLTYMEQHKILCIEERDRLKREEKSNGNS